MSEAAGRNGHQFDLWAELRNACERVAALIDRLSTRLVEGGAGLKAIMNADNKAIRPALVSPADVDAVARVTTAARVLGFRDTDTVDVAYLAYLNGQSHYNVTRLLGDARAGLARLVSRLPAGGGQRPHEVSQNASGGGTDAPSQDSVRRAQAIARAEAASKSIATARGSSGPGEPGRAPDRMPSPAGRGAETPIRPPPGISAGILAAAKRVPDGAHALVFEIAGLKPLVTMGRSHFRCSDKTVRKYEQLLLSLGILERREGQQRNNLMRGPMAESIAAALRGERSE